MKKLAWFLLGAGSFLSPCASFADAPDSLAVQAKTILQTHCASCHGGGKAAKGGFGFVLDRDVLVSRLMVKPGKAEQSELFVRVQQGEMPPQGRKERPSAAEVQVLKRWIETGAPAFEQPARAARILSHREVTAAILADLEKLDPRRRRFTRYLTLTHLSSAGRPERDLQTTREAAGKLLNFLSWHPRLTLLDSLLDGAVLRIDLRAYKWNAGLWERLGAVYPYRSESSSADMRAIAGYTGTDVAALRADWFVASASRPPLYHDLLQLPLTDRALERLLQVDVPGNLQDDQIVRAGFNDSGVSKNNRLIERHDAAYGAFWRSHDFEKNTGRQNLFEHPLGPSAGATSFQPAGGEIIFHLPNGLLGFLLVDAQGRRIEKAPGEIVSDPRRPDQRVETGISCMSCHARGFLPKADQLRGHVEKNAQVFGNDVLATIRATHPRKAAFQVQIDEDNVRYLKALEKFGVRDPDQEPINLVTQRYEGTLDGRGAAAELGLTLAEIATVLNQDRDLARILGGLLTPGGTVQRQVFEEKYADMARLVSTSQSANASPKGQARAAFAGHSGTVNAVAFSPDGKRAASGGDDRTIRLWDTPVGTESLKLESEAEVYAVVFSKDGKSLLSGGRDRLVRLWDLQTGKQVRVFRGHTDSVRCVAFSADGERAVSGGDDRSLRVWNVANGEEIATLAGHTKAISSVAWFADSQRVLSGSLDGSLRFWQVDMRHQWGYVEGHTGPVLSIALAPDEKTALSGGNDQTIRLWRMSDGTELHCFKGHANAVIGLHYLPGGRVFVSHSSQHKNPDRNWRRWDLNQQKEIGSRSLGEDHRFGCAAFSPDGRQVLVGGPGGFLRLWSFP